MTTLEFNRLKDQKSAYLLQHKDNPINWYAFGPEALQKAKETQKPIFLSIGYSSCHWCHVMADESFSDTEVAQFLNDRFISIKVDREEHPDIDNYYQQAAQLFIKNGGWPLSAFLLPDMRPFFVGTYYPNVKRGEGATFLELIKELDRAFHEEKDQVEKNAENVTESIRNGLGPKEEVPFQGHFPAPMAILDAIKEFKDKKNGGYGTAPKFPHFPFFEWSIEQILEGMVEKEHGQHSVDTLENMLMGGLSDHARGGVHRYSIDDKFLIPHFEKMLYDQAGLLKVLSKLSLIYPSPLVFDALVNTLDYLEAEMQSESGFFFSAQNADSEGMEGLYFTFTQQEFEDIIVKSSEEDDLIDRKDEILNWFQITPEGNFESKLNVVSLNKEAKDKIFDQESWPIIRKIRKKILEERKERVPPSTDNKGIASWNAMMISALVDVIQYCQIDFIKRKASHLFNKTLEGHYETFLLKNNNSGVMLRHTTTLETSLPYLEDFVTFCDCMIRVYEISGNPTFKSNFKDTLDFVLKEFVDDNKVYTRPVNLNDHELYPNQEVNLFDSSFQSMAMTLGILVKRARILFRDENYGSEINEFIETSKHFILRNPINGGQGLRLHTYPDNAYRVVKVPTAWLQKDEFINFISYFLSRFVLDYHNEENESWEICNFTDCELKGEGLKSFINTLRPTTSPQEESPND